MAQLFVFFKVSLVFMKNLNQKYSITVSPDLSLLPIHLMCDPK